MNRVSILLCILCFSSFSMSSTAYELGEIIDVNPPYEIERTTESKFQLNLKLPDLVGDECDFHSFGGNFVELRIGIRNDGRADAGPFSIFARAELLDENGNPLPFVTQEFMSRFYFLNTGTSHMEYFGDIQVLDRDHDQAIRVTVIVDPPGERQDGGEVWESNEQNNAMVCNYVLFGTGN